MITHITVHCSATRPGQNLSAKDIDRMHKQKGYRGIGYHYVIRLDGSVQKGRDDSRQGAHVKGHNKGNIGICLVGGLDAAGKAKNTYSEEQMHALFALLLDLCEKYEVDFGLVCGHRDWYGDTNGDGKVDKYDWLKECPCFNVREWFESQLKSNFIIEEL